MRNDWFKEGLMEKERLMKELNLSEDEWFKLKMDESSLEFMKDLWGEKKGKELFDGLKKREVKEVKWYEEWYKMGIKEVK